MESKREIECWAAMEKKGEIKPWKYEARALRPTDVEVSISHCGICGSDVHQIDSGWGDAIYPIVPGHEIIGTVVEVGTEVTTVKKGMRVGIGAQVDSCGECSLCKGHEEQLCSKRVFTYNARYSDGSVAYGGYSKFIRCNSHFAVPIPDNLPSDRVAPLLCAGVTTYAPLRHHNVGPGHKLGVLGIGGLGHLAVKWGKALGASVTALSSHLDKKNDCTHLGAEHFLHTADKNLMKANERTLDFILSTVSSNIDWGTYMRLLKPNGKFIVVGLPEEKLKIDPFAIISNQVSLVGSLIGSPDDLHAMFKLASEKNVLADIENYSIHNVNTAIENFRAGKPHYRYVLNIEH